MTQPLRLPPRAALQVTAPGSGTLWVEVVELDSAGGVIIHRVVHPYLHRKFVEAGIGETGVGSYSGMPGVRGDVADVLGSRLDARVAAHHGLQRSPAGHGDVKLFARNGQWHWRVTQPDNTTPHHYTNIGDGRAAASELRNSGSLVVADDPGAWIRAQQQWDTTVRLETVVDAEGACQTWVGDTAGDINDLINGYAAIVDADEHGHGVNVNAHVLANVDLEVAAPAGPHTLWSHQRGAVGRWKATQHGLVVVASPGTGKTRLAVEAIATSSGSSLIVAPGATHQHWHNEACAAGITTDIVTPQSLHTVTHNNYNTICVDEAEWLHSASQRTRTMWALRQTADRALVLTGTIASAAQLESLIRFAVNNPDLYRTHPLETAHPQVADRLELKVGPQLYTAHFGDIERPDSSWTHLTVTPRDDIADHLNWHLSGIRTAQQQLETATTRRQRFDTARQLRLLAQAARRGLQPTHPQRVSIIAETIEGKRAIVFASEHNLIDTLAVQLGGEIIDGRSRGKRRDRVIQHWNDGTIDCVIVGPAGERGVNLPGADIALHADLAPTLTSALQRTARVVRGGHSGHVDINTVAWADTWEQTVWNDLAAGCRRLGDNPLGSLHAARWDLAASIGQ